MQEDIDIYERLLIGGKKIRPSLVMLSFENFGGEPEFREGALQAATAYGLIHNAFLIFDDVQDGSSIRRGQPSVHEQYRIIHEQSGGILDPKQYGMALAINTANLGIFKALDTIWNIANMDERRIASAQRWLTPVIKTTLQGQRRDLTDMPLDEITKRYVYQIYHQKTAVYTIVGPLTLGAILAGTSGKDLEYLNKFGVNLGIAFQMLDDHSGLYGDEQILGKPVGSDLQEAKKTLHFFRAFQEGDANERAFLKRVWGNKTITPEELEYTRELIERMGIKDFVQNRADKLAEIARRMIPKITRDPTITTILESLTYYVVTRNF